MPKITAQGTTIDCESGVNLRQVLLKNGIDLHNDGATVINCRGIGTCGTCAVEIEGEVSEMDWREKARLSFPPHNLQKSRRLACQIRVWNDLRITKYGGFWGQEDTVQWKPEA